MPNSIMRKPTPVITSLFLALLLGLGIAVVPQAQAQERIENPDVTVTVDGLACPFCAYGLEKKLKKLDGVEALNVDMDEAEVRMTFKEGMVVSEERINKAVADAGFTVTENLICRKAKHVGRRERSDQRGSVTVASRTAGDDERNHDERTARQDGWCSLPRRFDSTSKKG